MSVQPPHTGEASLGAPPHVKRTLRWAAAIIGVLVVGYLCAAIVVWNRAPGPSVSVEERLQRALAVPPETPVAWPAIKRALEWQRRTAGTPPEVDALLNSIQATPGDPQWGDVQRGIENRTEEMQALRDAVAIQVCGFVPGFRMRAEDREFYGYGPEPEPTDDPDNNPDGDPTEGTAASILLPQLSTLRMAGHLLRADALMSVSEGQGERAVADIQALLHLGRHAAEVELTVCNLVSLVIQRQAYDTVERALALNADAFTPEQLTQLAQVISAPEHAPALRLGLQRQLVADEIQRTFTDDGAGNGALLLNHFEAWRRAMQDYSTSRRGSRLPPDLLLFLGAPVLVALAPDRAFVEQTLLRAMDELDTQAQEPGWKQQNSANVELGRALASQRLTTWMAFMPLASGSGAPERMLTEVASTRSARSFAQVRLACERFRRTTGKWPDALGDTVPRYLPRVPQYEFEEGPISLEHHGDNLVIGGPASDGGGT